MDSILTSVKKMLGIPEVYEQFDADLIMHINSVFFILYELGVGPTTPFTIEDKTQTWDEFIDNSKSIELVKSYMYLKVRVLFDPPTIGSVMESANKQIAEFEWRLNVAVDPEDTFETE